MGLEDHPFASLPIVSRAASRAATRFAAAVAGLAVPDAVFDAGWASLLGGPVTVTPASPHGIDAEALHDAWRITRPIAAVWSHASGTFVTACSRDLAFLVADRASSGALRWSPTDPLSAAAEGVLSAVAARAAVIVSCGVAPPVLRAITDHPGDALLALPDGPWVRWDLAVANAALHGVVSLVFAPTAFGVAASAEVPLREPLRSMRVPVRCLGAVGALAVDAVGVLRVGDRWRLDGLRFGSDGLAGDVTVAAGEGPGLRFDARISGARSVVVTDASGRAPEAPMSDAATSGMLVEVVVELASQPLAVGDVASWHAGSVVEFPQALGELVVLRAGGREVARGELVNVDGRVGVRITALR